MRKFFLGLAVACTAVPAIAQNFPGAMVAEYYMSELSIPKGWALSYKGTEQGTHVFIMDRDLDAFPQTSFLQPIDQLRRVMCVDESLKQMMAGGLVLRVDSRDKIDGKLAVTKGPLLDRC